MTPILDDDLGSVPGPSRVPRQGVSPQPTADDAPILSVKGGVAGFGAAVDTLEAAVEALRRVSGHLADVPDRYDLRLPFGSTAALAVIDPVDLVHLETGLHGAVGQTDYPARSLLALCVQTVDDLALQLSLSAAHYQLAEHLAHGWMQALTSVTSLVVRGSWWLAGMDPGLLPAPLKGYLEKREVSAAGPFLDTKSWRQVAAAGPSHSDWASAVEDHAVTTQAVAALILGAVGAGSSVPEVTRAILAVQRERGLLGGDAVRLRAVPPEEVGPLPTAAPRSAADLLRAESLVASDGDGPVAVGADGRPVAPRSAGDATAPGRILVQKVIVDGRVTGAIVTIPGTQTWSTGGPNPMDGQSDLELMAGQRSAAAEAVEQALTAAGVSSSTPLMLVGHSQGGMTAAALAGDASFRAHFHPVATLTAGSPVSSLPRTPDVAQLNLEHSDDVVPGLDGHDNPDRPEETTVSEQTPDGYHPHDVEGYALTAEHAQDAHNASVKGWEKVAAPFFAPGATVESSVWDVTRTQLSAR